LLSIRGTVSKLVRVGVVYAFSEANHAVFQNAAIWRLKNELGIEAFAYAPKEYLGLYWAASQKFLISPSPYVSVSEIQKFEKPPIYRKNVLSWLSSGGTNFVFNSLLNLLPTKVFHSLPKYLSADYKSRRFLFRSGIYFNVKKHFLVLNQKVEAKFLGTTMYTDPSNGRKFRRNLTEHFQVSFSNLFEQIKNGVFAEFEEISYESIVNKSDYMRVLQFIRGGEKVIFLRTRNLDNSVRFQNASGEKLRPVVLHLLEHGVKVINSGTPSVNLDLNHPNYLEFSHQLPVDQELRLALKCNFVMNSAWAGLFVAVSTLKTNLITFDREWSCVHLKTPISILKARSQVGMKDLALGDDLNSLKFGELGERILKYCQSID